MITTTRPTTTTKFVLCDCLAYNDVYRYQENDCWIVDADEMERVTAYQPASLYFSQFSNTVVAPACQVPYIMDTAEF